MSNAWSPMLGHVKSPLGHRGGGLRRSDPGRCGPLLRCLARLGVKVGRPLSGGGRDGVRATLTAPRTPPRQTPLRPWSPRSCGRAPSWPQLATMPVLTPSAGTLNTTLGLSVSPATISRYLSERGWSCPTREVSKSSYVRFQAASAQRVLQADLDPLPARRRGRHKGR